MQHSDLPTLLGLELHLGVSTLQSPVLHLNVSIPHRTWAAPGHVWTTVMGCTYMCICVDFTWAPAAPEHLYTSWGSTIWWSYGIIQFFVSFDLYYFWNNGFCLALIFFSSLMSGIPFGLIFPMCGISRIRFALIFLIFGISMVHFTLIFLSSWISRVRFTSIF